MSHSQQLRFKGELRFNEITMTKFKLFCQDTTKLGKIKPLSCSNCTFSTFSSIFSFDNSSLSFAKATFACSTSCLRMVTPSWYTAIFFFNSSSAAFPASGHVFRPFTLSLYSSLPSQQSEYHGTGKEHTLGGNTKREQKRMTTH